MSESFVILHLSDTHIGNPKYQWDSINLFDKLIKDLEEVSTEHSLQPNLIIFSGDLAFGELPEMKLEKQYELVDEFLNRVLAIFKNPPQLFLIPGNHDINRKKIDDSQKLYRDALDENKVERMMVDNDINFQRFLERQSEWAKFAKSKLVDFDFNDKLNFVSGIINYQDKKIGVVGLNSAWSSQGDGEQGKLWIGKNQMEQALESIKGADFKIAVSHHPHSWLHENEKNWIKERLQSNFQLYLHGHEHTDWFEELKNHTVISAGATYQGTKKSNGYSWISIDFKSRGGKIYLRTYSDRADGGLIPNYIPSKTDQQGSADLDLLFGSEKAAKEKSSNNTNPIVRSTENPSNLNEYIEYLEKKFDFRWEPPSNFLENTAVFWTVRLRTPTPIHAIQSFVAAGLQKFGCDIFLWLDDLGDKEYSVTDFFARAEKWFRKVDSEPDFKKRKFSELYDEKDNAEYFRSYVQDWLGKNDFLLPKILEVSKLISPLESRDEARPIPKRKPRRLLSPSMNWATLALLFNENKGKSIITLGGGDETPLWHAWKECVRQNVSITGHLFTPIMKDQTGTPLHMETNNIGWNSREDVQTTIREEINKEGWNNEDRLIPWCFNLFSLLPRVASRLNTPLTVADTEIKSFNEIVSLNLDQNELIRIFTDEFANWVI